jgi:two-component system, OmpR family, KDP operon response regulator KdpE
MTALLAACGPAAAGHARRTTILVAEDHPGLERDLRINLQAGRYDVVAARTGRDAMAMAAGQPPPDAVILDLGLPDVDSIEAVGELRRWFRGPIIVLSGRSWPADKIAALDLGADDYVTKPFAMNELLARLRAALRRFQRVPGPGRLNRATIGHWQVDLISRQVTCQDCAAGCREALRLTRTEWGILELLLQHPGQLVASADLLTRVWGTGFQQHTNYLRFHMARLRGKLEDDPARPRHLLTEPGMGYRYRP